LRSASLRPFALGRIRRTSSGSLHSVDLHFVAPLRSVALRRTPLRCVALRATPSARTSCQLGSNRVGIKFARPSLLLLASTGARRMESALSKEPL